MARVKEAARLVDSSTPTANEPDTRSSSPCPTLHAYGTVEGEMGVAGFLVNFLSEAHFWTLVALRLCLICTPEVPLLIVITEP